jgi:predicted deacylase
MVGGSESEAAVFPWSFIPTPGPGERRADYFTWPDAALAGLRFPYFAVRGREPGPSVAITAGVHGGEYSGPLAVIALGRTLDPATVRGALLILPLVNQPAFWARSAFVTPGDGLNLNRAFPGKAEGTISEALAHRLLTDVVEPADTLIDLHSGDIFETLADHSGRYHTDDAALAARTLALQSAFGLPYAEVYGEPIASRSLTGSAAARGKATLLVEVGGNGRANAENAATLDVGLREALRALGTLPGTPSPRPAIAIVEAAQVFAPATGLWRPAVALEQEVAMGDLLGTLIDPLGEPLADVTAPCAGMVLYYMTALAVHEGEPLVNLASRES